jgi:hypothetical protein
MARREFPFKYTPGQIPNFAPGETAEQYMSKLLPYLRDEFDNIRAQFNQLPIMPTTLEAPQAPFDGMTRIFNPNRGGWTPSGGPEGLYIYEEGNWYLINFKVNDYPHA